MSSTVVATSAGDQDAPRPSRIDSAHAAVRGAGLPTALADLVLGVTGKCRLWNSERIEVARELCAHFRDGLDAGVAPEELARSFGDPAQAAKLITATRRRLRPMWWRSARAALRASAALFLVIALAYGVLAARFFLVSPNVTHNYAAELNAASRSTPESERAWPLYIRAKVQFGATPRFMMDENAAEPMSPGEPRWEEMAAWLEQHTGALATLREAGSKAIVGYELRTQLEPDYIAALRVTNPQFTDVTTPEAEPENPLVVGLLLPHLGEMRKGAKWLRADAALAASHNDRARFMEDVHAILGIGEQGLRDRFMIGQLVGIAVDDLAVGLVLENISKPDLLTADDLRDLAHRFAAIGGGRVSIDTSMEIVFVEDVLQRFYSDDGHGDGYFVGGGGEFDRIARDFGIARARGEAVLRAYQPLQSVIMPSRAQLREKAQRVVESSAADNALPAWRHEERGTDALYIDLMESGVHQIMPWLASLYNINEPGGGMFANAFATRDLFVARRDALLAVIAAESHRRAHGTWPATLEQLVPAYLPRVPLDPFTGEALRYVPPKSEGEAPVFYSVGADRVDQGGKVATTEAGRWGVRSLRLSADFRKPPASPAPEKRKTMDEARADWVIWPVPERLPRETGK